MNDKCIRCSKETEYDINYPVDLRLYYIEGSGQLCSDCFHTLYPTPTFGSNDETNKEGKRICSK